MNILRFSLPVLSLHKALKDKVKEYIFFSPMFLINIYQEIYNWNATYYLEI